MGTTLTGTTPQDTYDSLIKVTDNGPLSGTAKYLSDGLGNDSALALSTSAAGVGTTTMARKFNIDGGSITSDTPTLRISSTDGSGTRKFGIEFYSNSGADVRGKLLADNSGKVYLDDNGGGGVVLQANGGTGNVGIGTSSPNRKLTVAGDSQFQDIICSTSIYLGGTAAANALDDYEEGTFTPTVEGSSTAGTATYSVQIGKYTKIGNQISILIDLAWSGGTGTGILRVVGLPFTNVSFNTAGTIGFIDSIALTASNYATMYVAPSSTRLDFVQSPTGGGSVTDVSYDAAGRLIVSATYFNA